MECKKFRMYGRLLTTVCAVGLTTSSLMAQSAPASKQSAASTEINPISRVDLFAGYSFLAPHGSINGNAYSKATAGAIGSGAYYFTKFLGGEVGGDSHPDGAGDGFTTLDVGPILRYPLARATPFVHVLGGVSRVGGPNYNTPAGVHMVNPYKWGPSLAAGGGLDYLLPFFGNHLSLRVFQADYQYMHVSFGQPVGNIEGGTASINALQLSTGLVYHAGSIAPPPPVTNSCTANPTEVYAGDSVAVTCSALNLNPKKAKHTIYSWSATGVKVGGDKPTTKVNTTDLAPGTYTVTGHVTEGKKPGQSADGTATFTVKPFQPPTIACSADPSAVQPGGSSTITCQGVSPQNRPLTFSYSASSGQISGSTNTATLNTTGVAPGVITVTGNVTDDKGQSVSATANVTVNAPPPPPAPKTEALCAINFDRDQRRPTRVDNEAKACLDDVALNLERNADAKAVLVGSSAPTEKKGAQMAAQRAVNTKDYLVREKGIDPSRIDVRTGSAGTRGVQNYLVPSGANFDTDEPGTVEVDTKLVKAQKRVYGHDTTAHTKKHHTPKTATSSQQ